MCDTERTQTNTPLGNRPDCTDPVLRPPVYQDPCKHMEYKPVCLMAILYGSLGASAILVALAALIAAMSAFLR